MLFHVVKRPTLFEAIKTIDGQVCQTYRETCFKLGLLENNHHWGNTLTEASETSHAHQIRTLFVIILTTCVPSYPKSMGKTQREYKRRHTSQSMQKEPQSGYTVFGRHFQ